MVLLDHNELSESFTRLYFLLFPADYYYANMLQSWEEKHEKLWMSW